MFSFFNFFLIVYGFDSSLWLGSLRFRFLFWLCGCGISGMLLLHVGVGACVCVNRGPAPSYQCSTHWWCACSRVTCRPGQSTSIDRCFASCSCLLPLVLIIMPPPIAGALSDDARLTSVWRLTSVTYIGPKSRTEGSRKTKIGTEVAHITRDSNTTFTVKRSKVNLQGAGTYCSGLPHSLLKYVLIPVRPCINGCCPFSSPRRLYLRLCLFFGVCGQEGSK